MELNDFRVQVEPGDGIVFRNDPVIVLGFPESPTQEAAFDQVLDSVDQTVGAGGGDLGRKLVRRLVGHLAQAEIDDVPDFAVVVGGPATALLINGSVDVVVSTAAGEERLSGRSVSSWLDRVVDAEVTELRVHRSDRDDVRPARRSDLRSGSVPAAGVMLLPGGTATAPPAPAPAVDAATDEQEMSAPPPPPPPPPPATPVPEVPPVAAPSVVVEPVHEEAPAPPPVVEPVADRQFESIALTDPLPEEEAQPLPVAGETAPVEEAADGVEVHGILCSRQHFNDPGASFCSTCGISMVHQTHNLVRGRRPPLGVLLADDGTTYALDSDYVIGREPDEHEMVQSGQARPLILPDPDRTISRAHARVMLDEWEVRVVDLRSANGTHVAAPDQTEWTALHPEEPSTIRPGSRILVGQRTFVYDSHHRR